MIRIHQLKLPVGRDVSELRKKAAGLLHLPESALGELEILRRSLDARRKPELFFSYTVLAETNVKDERSLVKRLKNPDITLSEKVVYRAPMLPEQLFGEDRETYFSREENRPRIIGFGPAGMFAGLLLARAGARPVIHERGAQVEERVRAVEELWRSGTLDPESNPQFGEGGAGTFSDGKLNTLVKDPEGRGRFVLEEFVRHGADPEICTEAKPHVGTDRLLDIVRGIREEILSLGGEIHFHSKYSYSGKESFPLILAIGHSARDSYEELYQAGLHMEAKDFAMGFRVQHPQEMIDRALYGELDEKTRALLGPAAYKLTHTAGNGRAVYSFCMCPGGYVVNSSSEEGRLCVNGMSYHARDGKNANAAIIVGIKKTDYQGQLDPLSGIQLQRELEERAWRLAEGKIPIERYGHFRDAVRSNTQDGGAGEKAPFSQAASSELPVSPEFRGEYRETSLSKIFRFPEDSPYAALNNCNEALVEAMERFERSIPGFSRPDAILAAVESRTSSPVRIPRDESFQANLRGVYPCGEGAGYAGGIMSAAMDGMKTAEALVRYYRSLL